MLRNCQIPRNSGKLLWISLEKKKKQPPRAHARRNNFGENKGTVVHWSDGEYSSYIHGYLFFSSFLVVATRL